MRVKGITSCTNSVLHPWLKEQLTEILATLPTPRRGKGGAAFGMQQWPSWQVGLKTRFTLRQRPPPLRMLLVLDNLTGHKSPDLINWMVDHGIMPLYTPISGSWLNMAESIQNILVQRGLSGTHPKSSDDIIAWLEQTARGWNEHPTPFVWGGCRALRRKKARLRYHALGKSGAYTATRVRRVVNGARAKRMTH